MTEKNQSEHIYINFQVARSGFVSLTVRFRADDPRIRGDRSITEGLLTQKALDIAGAAAFSLPPEAFQGRQFTACGASVVSQADAGPNLFNSDEFAEEVTTPAAPLQESQQSVGEWIDETFPGTDPESPRKSLRALEEMVELCFASGASLREVREAVERVKDKELADVAHHYKPFARRPVPEKIPAEAADVLIVLYGLAHMRGFDLHAEVAKKMAVNRARKWLANGDGTGYHVKESE